MRKLWRVKGTYNGKYKLQYSSLGIFWRDIGTYDYNMMIEDFCPTLYDSVEEAEQAAIVIATKELKEKEHKNKVKELGRLP